MIPPRPSLLPALITLALPSLALAAPPLASRSTSSWTGFSGVSYLFTFGDSYTTIGFNAAGTQPSASNPEGNPSGDTGTTSSGHNYIDYLTATYNKSLVLTYDAACYGATINASTVPAFSTAIPSAIDQSIQTWYADYHSTPAVPWTAANSLFSYFFGINDLLNTQNAYSTSLETKLMTSYYNVLSFAYIFGARNFLLQTVPPVDAAPGVVQFYNVTAVAAAVKSFNTALGSMLTRFRADHPGSTVFLHDTHALYAGILANPASNSLTAGIRNTQNYCQFYETSTSPDAFNLLCIYPVSGYFWHDLLHPTWPVHQAMAASIAALLG